MTSLGELLRTKLATMPEMPKVPSGIYRAEIYVCHPYDDSHTDVQLHGRDLEKLHYLLKQEMAKYPHCKWEVTTDPMCIFNYEFDTREAAYYATIIELDLSC